MPENTTTGLDIGEWECIICGTVQTCTHGRGLEPGRMARIACDECSAGEEPPLMTQHELVAVLGSARLGDYGDLFEAVPDDDDYRPLR